MWHAPSFWTAKTGEEPKLAKLLSPANLLSPLGALYGHAVARKIAKATPAPAPVPVICIGNVTLGGVGKTPFAVMLGALLKGWGLAPHFLLRGYGGTERGPARVTPDHTVAEVGDEALLLTRTAPTWVARDRPAGAEAAAADGADVIIMDDGFQNPSLEKTRSLLLIDGQTGLGNGKVFPAGPLRERAEAARSRADHVVIVGEGTPPLPKSFAPFLRARIKTDISALPSGGRVHAFAGIGRPEKFFSGLRDEGAAVTKTHAFADHHPFTPEEISTMLSAAKSDGAVLVTTEKDHVRVPPSLQSEVLVAPGRLTLEDTSVLEDDLRPLLRKD